MPMVMRCLMMSQWGVPGRNSSGGRQYILA
jgi:hypothetical protein